MIPLSGPRVALTVGDVTGSGIEVAAAMGQIRTALLALAIRDIEPEELLSCLHDITAALAPETGQPLTASCLYAVFDPVSRSCTAASAGHAPPLAVTPAGDAVAFDVPVGPLLGTGTGAYEPLRSTVPDGSLLALYTDGLVSASQIGPAAARETLRRLLTQPDSTLRQLADTAVYTLLPDRHEDDAVLLLARTRGLDDDRVAQWTLPDDPAVVATARRLADRQLAAWGLDEISFTTELIVSELVTNAIRYGNGPIRLRMIHDRSLVCEVSDGSSTAPTYVTLAPPTRAAAAWPSSPNSPPAGAHASETAARPSGPSSTWTAPNVPIHPLDRSCPRRTGRARTTPDGSRRQSWRVGMAGGPALQRAAGPRPSGRVGG